MAELEGDGLLDTLGSLFPTRQKFPPSVREMLKRYEGKQIRAMSVGRLPVQRAVSKLFNLITSGALEKSMENLKYDEMYHLFMLIDLVDGPTLIVEKNAVIRLEEVPSSYGGNDKMSVPMTQKLTLGMLLHNAVEKIGSSLYLYDLVDNNCQKFITDLLRSSNLLTPALDKFINQDVKKVIEGTPAYSRTIANLATEAAAKWNRFIHGDGRKKVKPQYDRQLF